ncbi:hypothetical protein ABI59_02440 [Acidobacteria bacterium Mor1]|nr:hypothetical protein ABI59_02440 [Acidobacteria bacterium Mor1]
MGVGSIALASSAGSARSAPLFTDATADSGIEFTNVCGAAPRGKRYLTESMGSGAAWLDYDGDGNLDLYLVNGSDYDRKPGQGEPNRLYRGNGKGGFADVTKRAGVGDRGWGQGVAVGDIDNDGAPDIYVTNLGANRLFRNRGDGAFEDITAAAGVGDRGWGSSAAFFDMDGDGDLDLYVANYVDFKRTQVPAFGTPEAAKKPNCTIQGIPVFCGPMGLPPQQDVLYRNNGDGTFIDVTRDAGLFLDKPRFALGVVTADFDLDGDQDVYVANDSVANSLWRNEGNGKFVDIGVRSLTALSGSGRAQAGMGTDFADFDGDGWGDLVVTNFSHDLNTIYRSQKGKYFIDDSLRQGLGVTRMALSWGTGFHDFDLDGDLDLFIANGHLYPNVDDYDNGLHYRQRNHLFVREGGKFHLAPAEGALGLARSYRGAAFGDYDNDGDVDILATAIDDAVVLLRNDTPRRGTHLTVQLRPTRSNRDAVGTEVRVTVDGKTHSRHRKGGGSYLSQSDPRLHFGLGSAKKARVEVRWPSGTVDVLPAVSTGRLVEVVEGKHQKPRPGTR